VISLIGSEQAEYIRARLSETVGEELMQRHSILCGDSATFQGTERDIVFLSMVADVAHKTALTMLRYEQRFNVAVSRGRDRVILVRSVRREDLHPSDLKARLIAHFENPMPLIAQRANEELDVCESEFERELMRRLLERGYRVQGQVGSLGFRIDMVVDDGKGRRLAVECDGDRFHGPEQWRQDMRRQRVLERVGWRFWRCFASSFYRDPDGVTSELFDMLTRMGIEPVGNMERKSSSRQYTEHRIISPPQDQPPTNIEGFQNDRGHSEISHSGDDGIRVGDKVVLMFADYGRRMSIRLTHDTVDLERGLLSIASPLGKTIGGAEEGDEIEFHLDDGRKRKVLIETVEKKAAVSAVETLSHVHPELS
jgi:very-short-patch-repair endonuclease